MIKETLLGLGQAKEIKILDVMKVIQEESYVYELAKRTKSASKVPVIPVLGEDNLITMTEIRLDEDYTLNELIEIANYDLWSELKNCCVIDTMQEIKLKHFNKIVAMELNKISGSIASTKELIEEQKINNTYHLCVNKADFKKLLSEVNEAGEKATKKIGNKFYYYDIEIAVIQDLLKPTMLDFNELIVRETLDIKEIKIDADMIRKGVRRHSIAGYYGLGFLNQSNIYAVK